MTGRRTVVIAGIVGGLAVAIGAFGAHAFPGWLASQGVDAQEVSSRLDTLEIGVRYQMYHALALLVIGLWQQPRRDRVGSTAVWLMLAGVILFSGGLYAYATTGTAAFARIVPIGGICYLASWIAVAVGCRPTP